MAAIAKVLLAMGTVVSGSDLAAGEATKELEQCGARVYIGHRAEQIGPAEVVVVSTAIGPDNPEVLAARAAGIPVLHRSEMLAEIMHAKKGLAVAGAHGKTTITSMLAFVLHHCGLDPTFVIGGVVPGLGGARYGRGELVIAEADESDRSFLRYRPHIAVVSSIESDHLEHYDGTFAKMVEAFGQFLHNVPVEGGLAILNAGDPHLQVIGRELACRVIWYGRPAHADYRALEIEAHDHRTSFLVSERGHLLGRFSLCIPGEHNVENALTVVAVARELGLEMDELAVHLAAFPGAKRRFEILADGEVLVVDDYAHHPSEIKATIAAARKGYPGRRLVAVFQPHRYTRTHFLFTELAGSFSAADLVVLTEVYAPPPDQWIPGAEGAALAAAAGRESGRPVHFVPERAELPGFLWRMLKPGDVVLFMGAGDITLAAKELAEQMRA